MPPARAPPGAPPAETRCTWSRASCPIASRQLTSAEPSPASATSTPPSGSPLRTALRSAHVVAARDVERLAEVLAPIVREGRQHLGWIAVHGEPGGGDNGPPAVERRAVDR